MKEKQKYNIFTPTTKIKEEYFYNFIEYISFNISFNDK